MLTASCTLDAKEDAKVLSVLAAGTGSAIDLDDLGLKKNYSFISAFQAMPTDNDLMLEVSKWNYRRISGHPHSAQISIYIVILSSRARHRLYAHLSRLRTHAYDVD
jgi:hypothetical protein